MYRGSGSVPIFHGSATLDVDVMFRSVAVCAVRDGGAEPGPVPGSGRPPQPGD
jgi:hypothetical protein